MVGLTRWHDGLWTAEMPHRLFGVLELGARSTIVRLASGELFVHSPIQLDDELKAKVDELGPVRQIVAPNRFHHLFAGDWARAYPDARLLLAPGLDAKRSDLRPDGDLGNVGVLGNDPDPAWSADLGQALVEGAPSLSEVVFHHRATRTLITTDLLANFHHQPTRVTGWYLRMAGIHGRAGVSRPVRLAYSDRAAAAASLRRIFEWDFERVILAHGQVIEIGGKEILRDAYAWLAEGMAAIV